MITKKSTITVCGLTALVLAFGLVLTGCPDATSSSDTSDLPSGPDTTPPAKVSGLVAHNGAADTEAWLVWTDPADADFDHVEITGTGITGTEEVAKGDQVLHIEGMNSGATGVTYSVISVDKTGNKSEAEASAAITLEADSTPPGAITGVTAATHASTEGAISITWTLPGDTDIAKVTIDIDDGAGGPATGSPIDLPRNATSYTWTGLTDTAAGYVFTINTEDFAGLTGTSADTSAAHPQDTTAPEPVSNETATGGSATLTVAWDASTSADENGVIIRVYSDSGHGTKVGNDVVVAQGTVSKDLTTTTVGASISDGAHLYVRIYAVDFTGNESTPEDIDGDA
jgi:hypothetical protein